MKKFLSLVLALVMTMSLVTVSAGAKDFTDDGEITYKEAVDVISGIGVVDGYSDGDFRPDDVLTRGAAAKIICNLILGPTTASALSAGTAPFKDVPVTNNFAGYITYCSQQGIISCYADGTFRPQGTLSGNAFMKMLLGALGYDGSNENYTGPNWQVSVIKQASGIGLDDGNDEFLGSKAVTRQEAALYAFNMLQATMVEYDKKDTIVVGDITINSNSTRKDVENTAKNETIEDDDKMQFAEKYFEKLVAEDDVDSFGRPSTTWKFDGDKLGTYANDADTTYVVADANKDLATLATDSDYLDYAEKDILKNADVYYNGDLVGEYSKVSDEVLAGKGDIVEAYENDDNEVSAIVIRSYTFAKIDSVDKDLSSSLTNKGASVGIDLVDVKGNDVANGTYYDNHDDDDKVLNGYTSDYTEGTALAVAVSAEDDATILDSYIIDSVSGKPSAAREVKVENKMVTEGTITLDGTKYDYAAQMTGIDNCENVDFDEEYEVFLTAEGYVLAVDGASYATLKDVYYVAGVYGETSRGNTTYYAQAISVTDGTEHQLKLDVDKDDSAGDLTDLTGETFKSKDAGLYIMDEDDGKYTAEKYIGQDSYSVVVDTLDQDVTNSSSTIRFTASKDNANNDGKKDTISRLYLDETTFFVGVEDESEDISISTATGVMSVEKASAGLKVYAIYKDGEDDAVFVVYAAEELNGAVNKDDVVYLTDDAKTSVKDGYIVDLYFMKDLSLSEGVTIDDAGQTTQGFYVFTVDGEVYKLKTDSSNELRDEVTDNSDGYGTGIVFDSVKNTNVSSDDDQFVGVSFKDATVIDTRSSSEKKADIYSNDIESTSRLTSAIEKGEVTADVYVEDGEIIFVAVTACENAAETPEKPDVDAKEFSSVVDTKVKGYEALSLKNAEVSRSGVLTLPALDGENIAVQIEDAMAYLGYTDVNLKKSGSVYTITATKDKIEEEITCDLDENVTYYVEITLDGTTQYVLASTEVADLDGVNKATYVMIDDTATEVSRLSNKTVEDGSVYVTGYYKVTAPVDKTSDNEGVYTATVDKEYAKKGETVTVKVTTKTAATSGTDTITLTDVSGGNAAVGQEAAALNESLTFTYKMGAADSQATINVVNA